MARRVSRRLSKKRVSRRASRRRVSRRRSFGKGKSSKLCGCGRGLNCAFKCNRCGGRFCSKCVIRTKDNDGISVIRCPVSGCNSVVELDLDFIFN